MNAWALLGMVCAALWIISAVYLGLACLYDARRARRQAREYDARTAPGATPEAVLTSLADRLAQRDRAAVERLIEASRVLDRHTW